MLQKRYLTANVFKFHAWGQKCHFRNCQFGTFDPLLGIQIILRSNTYDIHISILCLCLFQIQNLRQFLSKSGFSQKDTHTAFSFLFPSTLLSCQHHLKAKFGIYFAQQLFCIFKWCEYLLSADLLYDCDRLYRAFYLQSCAKQYIKVIF